MRDGVGEGRGPQWAPRAVLMTVKLLPGRGDGEACRVPGVAAGLYEPRRCACLVGLGGAARPVGFATVRLAVGLRARPPRRERFFGRRSGHGPSRRCSRAVELPWRPTAVDMFPRRAASRVCRCYPWLGLCTGVSFLGFPFRLRVTGVVGTRCVCVAFFFFPPDGRPRFPSLISSLAASTGTARASLDWPLSVRENGCAQPYMRRRPVACMRVPSTASAMWGQARRVLYVRLAIMTTPRWCPLHWYPPLRPTPPPLPIGTHLRPHATDARGAAVCGQGRQAAATLAPLAGRGRRGHIPCPQGMRPPPPGRASPGAARAAVAGDLCTRGASVGAYTPPWPCQRVVRGATGGRGQAGAAHTTATLAERRRSGDCGGRRLSSPALVHRHRRRCPGWWQWGRGGERGGTRPAADPRPPTPRLVSPPPPPYGLQPTHAWLFFFFSRSRARCLWGGAPGVYAIMPYTHGRVRASSPRSL